MKNLLIQIIILFFPLCIWGQGWIDDSKLDVSIGEKYEYQDGEFNLQETKEAIHKAKSGKISLIKYNPQYQSIIIRMFDPSGMKEISSNMYPNVLKGKVIFNFQFFHLPKIQKFRLLYKRVCIMSICYLLM